MTVRHTASDPHGYMQAVREVVQKLDPSLAVVDMQTMDEHLGFAFYPARISASLLGLFSVLGLGLAMLGLYGVLAFMIRRRTRELGIRMALGAQKKDVIALVLRQGSVLVAMGAALGIAAAFAAARLVAGTLYGVSSHDPVTFAGVPVVLGAVALLAIWLPARKAARVTPTEALRYE